MECVLLVVSNKFKREDAKCSESQDVVGGCEVIMRLQNGGDESWYAEEEEKEILDGGNKREVYDLEEPSGDLGAENGPAVIFVLPKLTMINT